ncbi:MAG: PQQ-binding-like beta-propeller repeat protein [Planctomycetaceae bacterium]|nr:PQQ-binding-like beta-propeller repeat protein [Planctomycetaceae bacterium]
MRCHPRLAFVIAAAFFALIPTVHSGDWPGWRGPLHNGQAPGSGYPTEWSAEKNLTWSVEVPGIGASTPAVAGDNIFLTTTVNGENLLLCYGMDSKPRWQQALGKAVDGKPGKDGTGANPSVTTDGKYVFAYFKSGDLGCCSVDGKLQWETNLQQRFGEDTLWWDLGTSPILVKDAVVVACMQTGPSYLAAFHRQDGKLLWKQDRDLGAPEEAAQSYSTPVVSVDGDAETIIVLGADHVTAHDAATGRELWRVGGLNPTQHKYFRSIAGPAVSDGIVIAPYARGDSLTAIQLGGSGDVTDSHILWMNQETSADVPTPAIANGRVFICRDLKDKRGTIDCLDLKTGKTIWSGQLDVNRNTYRSSPIVADGKLYVTRQDGTVFVLDAFADEFKVLATNSISDEHTVATPVFVDGHILIRSSQHLYCIGS